MENINIPLTLRVDEQGRVRIPANLRKQYQINKGDFVVVMLERKA